MIAQSGTLLMIAKRLYTKIKDDEITALGAQLTYYLILAFFPFLIFLFSLFSFTTLSARPIVDNLIAMLPAETGAVVEGLAVELLESRSTAMLSFGMLAAIWTASNGINAIIKGLNKAYEEKETRPFWKVRGLSVIAMFVLAFVMMTSVLLIVFGRMIGILLLEWLGHPPGFAALWNFGMYAIPLAAMLLVFTLMYKVTPNHKLTWRAVLPGAFFTTAGWIVTSTGFAFYVNQFGSFTRTYGSIGAIIVLLIWLYISSIIVLLGGELNAVLASIRRAGAAAER